MTLILDRKRRGVGFLFFRFFSSIPFFSFGFLYFSFGFLLVFLLVFLFGF